MVAITFLYNKISESELRQQLTEIFGELERLKITYGIKRTNVALEAQMVANGDRVNGVDNIRRYMRAGLLFH